MIKTKHNNRIFIICIAAVCAISLALCFITPSYTRAKYEKTVQLSAPITINTSVVEINKDVALEWLISELHISRYTNNSNLYQSYNVNSQYIYAYWIHGGRLNKSSDLNNTGGYWGVHVSQQMRDLNLDGDDDVDELNFSFRMRTYSGSNVFTIYYTNTYVGNLSPSIVAQNVYKYSFTYNSVTINGKKAIEITSLPDTCQVGSMTLKAQTMNVNNEEIVYSTLDQFTQYVDDVNTSEDESIASVSITYPPAEEE